MTATTWSSFLLPFILYLDIMNRTVTGAMISACLKKQKKSLDIKCPSGSMVQILRAFYGYSPSGSCQHDPNENNCTLDEEQNYPCTGRESCSINLPSGNVGRMTNRCNNTNSNYFQVEYKCVKDYQTLNLCENKYLTAQSGYISTPRYPNNLHGPFSCNMKIEVLAHQQIHLHIIDLDLKSKTGSNCTDYLYIDQILNSITLCGRRSNERIDTLQNVMNLMLTVGSKGSHKGLWLYYEAFPPLPTSTPPMTTTMKLSLKNSKLSIRNSQHYHSQPEQEKEDSMIFVAAVASGVIGTLVFILIALLALLVFKIQRERRIKEMYISSTGRNRDMNHKSKTQTICNCATFDV